MQPKKVINLNWGKPAPSLLPVANLGLAIQEVLGDPKTAALALEYGDGGGPATLRQEVATSLTDFYSTPNSADEICITGGSSQGLATVLQVLTDPPRTKCVWVVAPCFYLASRIFEDAGLTGKLRAVPETDEGINLEFLERAILQVEIYGDGTIPVSQRTMTTNLKPADPVRKSYTHLIYLVPTFSNPSGRTIPLSQRRELVALARRFDALIVSDDIYDCLSYSPLPLLPRLVDIERVEYPTNDPSAFGHALSLGSFSKLIGPGVRTGWISASPSLTRALAGAGASLAGGCPSTFCAAVLAHFLSKGWLMPHVTGTLLPAYTERRCRMASAVRKLLGPLDVRIVEDDTENRTGGFFLWLKLPDDVDGSLVAQRCVEMEALVILPGELFEVVGDCTEKLKDVTFKPFLRLSFSWEDVEDLEESVKRLQRVLTGVISEQRQGLCR